MQLRSLVAVAILAAAAPAQADRVVAVAPLSTLGAEDKSAATKKLLALIEQAIAALPATKVISATQVADAIKKANRPQLRQCEGDAACLADIGKLVGAQIVVTGEVGGLGESQVVYLGATDVATAKELRSTTLAIGGTEGDTPAGASIRLLDPDNYKGVIRFTIDAAGATIFVNGTRVTLSPKGELWLPVGTQAIRVTHPEYHDFVKFVDVSYDKPTTLLVGMTQYPIVEDDVRAAPTSRDKIDYIDPPLWRRWYVAGPAVVALVTIIGIVWGVHEHDRFPSYQGCRMVSGSSC